MSVASLIGISGDWYRDHLVRTASALVIALGKHLMSRLVRRYRQFCVVRMGLLNDERA